MRLLLDESLPRGLKRLLSAHEVVTVPEQGWAGKSNSELLRLAEEEFDAFLTADQNVEYQQNIRAYRLAVIVLAAQTTRLEELEPLIPAVLKALRVTQLGDVVRVSL
jgi:predicted nuclease of predicted toxin-antitoxin system